MNHPWWQTGVIYQIYPRSFRDSNGDGVGDLHGITEQLPYLAEVLGVDAVWISPFYTSPMADFGYDVADYRAVDPLFGTLEDFDTLLARARGLDLKVLVDFVPNHSSDQHPWFEASRRSRDDAYRDWYVWRDPAPDGGPPNNWLSIFGGSAWEMDETTKQYYLHSFLKEQPDLNWRNPRVRTAMFDHMRFWLDRGVDGFRIDVAHYLMKDPLERSNPPAASGDAHKALGDYDAQQHLYDHGHDDIHDVHREMRALLDAGEGDRVALGEIHEFDWDTWARYYGNGYGLHMPINFGLLKAPWTASGVRGVVDAVERVVPPGAWPNYVLGNHDETRLASRLGPDSRRLAAMLLLTLRGTPTLYYGDEVGMLEASIPPERQQDPWGRRVPGLGRDGCRTPMQWDAAPGGGFTSGDPWLPLGPSENALNVSTQLQDAASLLNLYRRLLRLRRTHPALQNGSYRAVDGGDDDVYCFVREADQMQFFVALNFKDSAASVQLPAPGRILCWTHSPDQADDTVEILFLDGKAGVIAVLYDD